MKTSSLVAFACATLIGAASIAVAAPKVAISAPAGKYKVDPYHSSLSFKVQHVGLAPYVARFTKIDAMLELDPVNVGASKLSVTIDPTSVRTDFSGDYQASHKGSPYKSFDEALAQDAKFFNAGKFAQVTFNATRVEAAGADRLKVTGDLNFLGQTHPVTLDVLVTGSLAQHPWTKAGAVGFTATGTFKRSAWGMTHMVNPPMLGDAVSIEFNGEFHQEQATPPAN